MLKRQKRQKTAGMMMMSCKNCKYLTEENDLLRSIISAILAENESPDACDCACAYCHAGWHCQKCSHEKCHPDLINKNTIEEINTLDSKLDEEILKWYRSKNE